jgi:hypothetical protein
MYTDLFIDNKKYNYHTTMFIYFFIKNSNSFSLNPITGDLIWDTPNNGSIGEYNVAFVVEEWRNGILIGFVTRDMQITVSPCTNQPPAFLELPDLCVDAGTVIQFDVTATDADFPAQQITLSATGGPFQFDAPFNAEFVAETGNKTSPNTLRKNLSSEASKVTSRSEATTILAGDFTARRNDQFLPRKSIPMVSRSDADLVS